MLESPWPSHEVAAAKMVQSTRTYLLDDLCVDTKRRQVFRDGRPIAMPPLSFNTLLALIKAAPTALSVDELIEQAWGGLVVSGETVTQRIRLLRQTLGDDIQQPRYIETVRHEGYRLIPPVNREPAIETKNTSWSAIAALSSLLIGVLVWYWPVNKDPIQAEENANIQLPSGPVMTDELVANADQMMAQRNPESLTHAINLYQEALALDPDHVAARASLAYLQQVKGRLVEALSNNIIAMEGDQSGKLDVQVASCLRLLGFSTTAGIWLERADKLDPDSAHAAVTRAQDLLTRKLFTQAEAVINSAITRGIIQEELYEYLAILALQAGDLQTASSAISSAPQSIAHRDSLAIWHVIINTILTQETAPAIRLINELKMEFDSGFTWPGNYVYLAMLETVSGRQKQAFAALKKLQQSGYRDYQWLALLPPLDPLKNHNAFRETLAVMKADVEKQRQQVLTASWLPDGISEDDLSVSKQALGQPLAE